MSFFTLGAINRIKKDHYLVHLDKLVDWKPIEDSLRGMHVNEVNPKGGPEILSKVVSQAHELILENCF